ncbi:MAG TPA: TolC family protein [Draconibacterium sp.]|nr:TolC family protein [Draconibacterium sp.]
MHKITYFLTLLMLGSRLCFGQQQSKQVIPLDTIFSLSERNSTHLKLSEVAIGIKEAAVEVARNSLLPSIDVDLSLKHYGDGKISDRNFSNITDAPIPDFGNDFSLQASYLVFAGGAISATIEKSTLETEVAALSHEKNRVDIHFLVAGHYLDLYKLYNQKQVFEKNIEQTDEVIRQVEAKLSAGMALDNDLTRYELLRQNLKLSLIEIENNISIINQHLVITLGLPEETVILPDSSVQLVGEQRVLDNNFLQTALDNRQEIQIQNIKKQLAQKNITLAKADLYPSVALVVAEILTGPILVEVPPINKNLNYWFAGVAVKYNIGALYKSKKNIALAEKAYVASNIAYDAELEQTATAVHSAWVKYSEAFEKLATYKKSFELADENYSVINNRYKNDLVLITEILDASNMKLNAELQVINAKLDVVYQYFKLLRETGTL